MTTSAALLLPAHAADAEAARVLAQTCVACHGPEGNSPSADVPSLAGQPKQFITTQLVMFREGNRKNALMSPMAAPLSNPQIDSLGSYFSAQALKPTAAAQSADAAQAGQKLTQALNCVQCHGADLKGQQHIPRLAGQQAAYLKTQLTGFKAGTRFDMDGNMTAAAQALAPEAIETLATYLGALH